MATLQDLLSSIPTAQDGAVITIDYHNALVAAIKALAARGGSSGASSIINLSFAPAFISDATPGWTLQQGIATKGSAAGSASGWLNIQLPDGYQIDHAVMTGRKTGNVGVFQASLVQQALGGTDTTSVLSANLDSAAADPLGNFSVTTKPATPTIVNNSQSKYLLTARIVGADAASTASIFAIQVVCTVPSGNPGFGAGFTVNTGGNILTLLR